MAPAIRERLQTNAFCPIQWGPCALPNIRPRTTIHPLAVILGQAKRSLGALIVPSQEALDAVGGDAQSSELRSTIQVCQQASHWACQPGLQGAEWPMRR